MKKTIAIVSLMFALAMTAQAQIFIQEGDENNLRESVVDVGAWPVNPQNDYGAGTDDYVPISEGAFLLALFGGAYLLKTKRSTSLQNK